jgi:hypothetical protein
LNNENNYPDCLIDLVKNKESTLIYINFDDANEDCYDSLGILNTKDSMTINLSVYKDYYELYYDSTILGRLILPEEVKKIYWQKDLGIIKYDLQNGDSFVRINL